MSLEQDDIRGLLQPFIDSLKNADEFSEQMLFDGRDALKHVFDRTNSRGSLHQPQPQAQAFWSIQAMVGGLIRKGHVDQATALGAIHSLLESLVEWAESTPGGTQVPGLALGQDKTPQAARYLKLADLPSLDSLEPAEAPDEAPFVPAKDNCLGQLLVRSGKLSNAQLSRALSLQNLNGRRLGEVLIAMEAVGIQTLEEALTRQKSMSSCKPSLPAGDQQLRLKLDR